MNPQHGGLPLRKWCTSNFRRHQGRHYNQCCGLTSWSLCKCGDHHNWLCIAQWQGIISKGTPPTVHAKKICCTHYLCNGAVGKGSILYHDPKVCLHPWLRKSKNRQLRNQVRWGALQASNQVALFIKWGQVCTHQWGSYSDFWTPYWSWKVLYLEYFWRSYCIYRIEKGFFGSLWWDRPLQY